MDESLCKPDDFRAIEQQDGNQNTLIPNEGGFRAIARQDGNRSTMISNNGLDLILSRVQQVAMEASQNGNDNFQSTNNAVTGDETKQLFAHTVRIENLKKRPDLQKQKGGQVRVTDDPAKLKARGHPTR